MSLILDGTNGVSDIDGSASTPAIRGTDANTGIFFGTDVIGFSEGGVQSGEFNASGNLKLTGNLSVGGATPATSGSGITFPATQSASSDANTLDDYEEGTWTPAIIGSTSQSGQVYSSQVGTYTKIGRQVTARFYLQLSTEGTFSGFYLLISGLPFTIAATPGNVMGGGVYFVDMATNYIAINLQCEESGARLYLLGVTAAATSRAYVGITDLTNTTQFSGTVTYFT